MGEVSQFKGGEKAPNNGVYIEVGETGSGVKNPQQVEMHAGEKFPETKNNDRVWKNKRSLSHPSPQNSRHTT
ncbi:YjzC-like protein [Oceanobacillus limi]|uniref:YjzC-like protein n=1 Tax=Oceanobacillus limi TaxID=930131 RepID=A0A1I0CHY0_9BACI|nr:YjzC family protein [Oceanobacillus limi]SET19015.1 YjzC-like protein [Oceanobacillus limi]